MKKIRYIGAGLVLGLWLVLTLAAWFGPAKDVSEAERRKLAQFPELTVDTVLSGKFMSNFDTYTQDQFPLRDNFRQIKSLFHYYALWQRDNNDIYMADGYAAAMEYPLNETSLDHAGELFTSIYDTYLADTGSKVVFTVAPDKGYYLAAKNGYLALDYGAMFSRLQAATPWAEFVDITGCLSQEDYYRTDTHWRQERILPVAQKLAQALGVTAPQESDYTRTPVDRPFYGVYYGQAALPMPAEKMYYLDSPLLEECTVTNLETPGTTAQVYDLTKLTSRDLYDIYLSGAAAMLTIENPNATTHRELIVFRDSFGSSLVPLLVGDYETVTVLDLRYLPSTALGNYVDFHGQDVLFLYSPLVLNNSFSMK